MRVFELQEPFFAVIIRKIKGVRQLIKIKIFKSRFTLLKKASMVTLAMLSNGVKFPLQADYISRIVC